MRAGRSAAGRILLGVAAVLAAAVAFGAWAISSPVGAASDDDFHVASLWCAPTAAAGFCAPVPGTDSGDVRSAVSVGLRCFVIDESASGACVEEALADEGWVRTHRANFTTYNPQGFYLLLGPLAGEDVAASVLTVRAVNAALFLAIVGGAFLLLPAPRRPALVWGVLITIVPTAMSLIPSTNPQSWTFGAAAVSVLGILGALDSRGPRRWALVGLVVLATGLALLARSDALLVAVVAAVVVLVLRFAPSRRGWWLVGALAGLVALGVVGFLSSGQRGYLHLRPGGYGLDDLGLAVVDTLAMPLLWYRVVAGPVGWQDVPLSPIVGVLGGLVLLAAIVLALRAADRRMRVAIWSVVVTAWLVPLGILVNNGSLVGMYVQPRYLAPLFLLLGTLVLVRSGGDDGASWAGVAGRPWRWSGGSLRVPAWAAWAAAAALAVAHSVALHGVLRRYATGTDVAGFDLDAGAEWSWPGGPSPMVVWAVGSLAWAVVLACAVPLVGAPAAARQKRTRTSDAS